MFLCGLPAKGHLQQVPQLRAVMLFGTDVTRYEEGKAGSSRYTIVPEQPLELSVVCLF